MTLMLHEGEAMLIGLIVYTIVSLLLIYLADKEKIKHPITTYIIFVVLFSFFLTHELDPYVRDIFMLMIFLLESLIGVLIGVGIAIVLSEEWGK